LLPHAPATDRGRWICPEFFSLGRIYFALLLLVALRAWPVASQHIHLRNKSLTCLYFIYLIKTYYWWNSKQQPWNSKEAAALKQQAAAAI
jgi:hypothetical protein